MARPVEGIGTAELQQLEESSPKQHRFLRTLLEIGQPVELRDLLRRLNLSDSPAKTLARRGWIVLEKIAANDASWEGMVPVEVAEVIKTRGYFGANGGRG